MILSIFLALVLFFVVVPYIVSLLLPDPEAEAAKAFKAEHDERKRATAEARAQLAAWAAEERA